MKKQGLVILMLLAVPAASLYGGSGRWTVNGPEGAAIRTVAIAPSDPSRMYAAGEYGFFRSTNGGGNWVRTGLSGALKIVVDPADANTVFAIPAFDSTNKLHKSADGGQTWQVIQLPGSWLQGLAADPRRPGTIYAGVIDGVLKSRDGGVTWSMITIDRGMHTRAIAVDPFDSNRIYVAALSKGLYVTNDGGERWVGTGAVGVNPSSIALDPGDPNSVIVGKAFGEMFPDGNIYISKDRGATWEARRCPGFSVHEVIVAQGHTIYVATSLGLARSFDSGSNWTTPEHIGELGDLAATGETVLYGTSAGVFLSRSPTTPLEQVNSGLGFASTTSIHLDPLDPRHVYAATYSGVFESGDAGATWARLDSEPAEALAVDPEDRSVIYSAYREELRKTSDHGISWKSIQLPKGTNFSAQTYELAVNPTDSRTVYAALQAGFGKSTDSGETWVLHTSGIPAGYYGGHPLYGIEVNPAEPSTIVGLPDATYLSDHQVARSTDAGVTWRTLFSSGFREAYELAIDPFDPNVWSAAVFIDPTIGYGFARTADGGATWTVTRFDAGFVLAIAVVPGTSTVYAAHFNRGVIRSDDGGTTWIDFDNEGLNTPVDRLAVDRTGKHLYAATRYGVYSYTFGPDVPIDRLTSDPTRLSRLLGQLNALKSPPGATTISAAEEPERGLVLPVAASNAGANGTYFRSDVTLANYRPVAQDVLVAFLAAGTNGTDPASFRVTLPPFKSEEAPVTITDFVAELGLSGSGAFVVIAIDASGDVDPAAKIGGYSRVWTRQQGSVKGTTSQALPLVGYENLFRSDRAVALGLRLDNGFRTNLGVVNLESTPRTFQVEIGSEQQPARTMTIDVPAYSMRQVPVNEAGLGSMTATFSIAGGAGLWTAYGVSVDNRTGDGWVSQALATKTNAAGGANTTSRWLTPDSGVDGVGLVVQVDPRNPRIVYAGTSTGLFVSENAGRNWRKLDSRHASTIALDPRDPSVIYTAIAYYRDAGTSTAKTLRKTTDGGLTWQSIALPVEATHRLIVDPSDSRTIYAGLANGLGKSVDSGATWDLLDGMPYHIFYGTELNDIAVSPQQPTTIFAAGFQDLGRSVDGGRTWQAWGIGLDGWIDSIAIDPSEPDVMYAWGLSGFFRSTDAGDHWTSMNAANYNDFWIWDIAVDPRTAAVYVGTRRGVFRSLDGGSTWIPFNEGLSENTEVYSVAIDPTGTYFYAATTDGVFRRVVGQDVSIERLSSDGSRLSRLLSQLDTLPSTQEEVRAVVLPVAASTAGGFGTYFRSDVTLANYRSSAQDVLVAFLEAGKDGRDAPSYRITVPPFKSGEPPLTLRDIIAQLDLSGVGALVLIAIDANGNIDPAGTIGGYSRVWTYQGDFSRATSSQALPMLPHQDLLRAGRSAALGLRLDTEFRTNLGVVNLESRTRSFQVTLGNEKQSAKTVAIDVPPFSMMQVSAGQHDLGSTTATFTPLGEPGLWTAYGSSVDNHTGDGWVSEAVEIP